MITQNFGAPGIAERTLDIYTAAVLAEKFVDHVAPKPVWRKRMDTLSEVSCDAYRTVITGKYRLVNKTSQDKSLPVMSCHSLSHVISRVKTSHAMSCHVIAFLKSLPVMPIHLSCQVLGQVVTCQVTCHVFPYQTPLTHNTQHSTHNTLPLTPLLQHIILPHYYYHSGESFVKYFRTATPLSTLNTQHPPSNPLTTTYHTTPLLLSFRRILCQVLPHSHA